MQTSILAISTSLVAIASKTAKQLCRVTNFTYSYRIAIHGTFGGDFYFSDFGFLMYTETTHVYYDDASCMK